MYIDICVYTQQHFYFTRLTQPKPSTVSPPAASSQPPAADTPRTPARPQAGFSDVLRTVGCTLGNCLQFAPTALGAPAVGEFVATVTRRHGGLGWGFRFKIWGQLPRVRATCTRCWGKQAAGSGARRLTQGTTCGRPAAPPSTSLLVRACMSACMRGRWWVGVRVCVRAYASNAWSMCLLQAMRQ